MGSLLSTFSPDDECTQRSRELPLNGNTVDNTLQGFLTDNMKHWHTRRRARACHWHRDGCESTACSDQIRVVGFGMRNALLRG
eukprot:3105854-Rhodomonas_salina.1